ncbi:unnamed protein product [Calypogeia fissa]
MHIKVEWKQRKDTKFSDLTSSQSLTLLKHQVIMWTTRRGAAGGSLVKAKTADRIRGQNINAWGLPGHRKDVNTLDCRLFLYNWRIRHGTCLGRQQYLENLQE